MFKKTAIKKLVNKWKKGSFGVVFWDGDEYDVGDEKPRFKIIFHREPQITDIKSDVVMTFGEAYMHGVIDFEGSFADVIGTMFENTEAEDDAKFDSLRKHFHFDEILKEYRAEDRAKERENIHEHYDLGNDFFSQWLDPTMCYSCAYFEHPTDTLQQAQEQKIMHTLRKLELHEGESLLDIGCGWGWLIVKAAEKYHVHATGITLSEEQYEGAKKLIHEHGVDGLADVQLMNYMDMDETKWRFDKAVSIGMLEHVGEKYLPLYLAKVHRLLKDNGLFLLHSIMKEKESTTNSWMTEYIFPGGYLPVESKMMALYPEFDFHVVHMESLRRHYAMTLHHWYENFKRCEDSVKKEYGEEFVRMWGLYLQGCEAAFETGHIDVFQTLLTKGVNNDIAMTGDHIYER